MGSAARDAHTAHLRALGGTLPTESAAPATPVPATPVPAPGPALRQSVVTLQAAANAAQRGATAALLASIAASHAAMPAAP